MVGAGVVGAVKVNIRRTYGSRGTEVGGRTRNVIVWLAPTDTDVFWEVNAVEYRGESSVVALPKPMRRCEHVDTPLQSSEYMLLKFNQGGRLLVYSSLRAVFLRMESIPRSNQTLREEAYFGGLFGFDAVCSALLNSSLCFLGRVHLSPSPLPQISAKFVLDLCVCSSTNRYKACVLLLSRGVM